jgi:hypothetical protein
VPDASGVEVTATPLPPTRAEHYGYADRTQRIGPQAMTGAAPTAQTPPSSPPGYDDYDEFWQPRRNKIQRWMGWLGRKSDDT